MKTIAGAVMVLIWSAPGLFAGALDTTVFRTRMLPENEIPALSLPGTSAAATITVRVVRDGKGNVSAATVVFDIDYTFGQPMTIVGMHIHNAPAGVNGAVVINSGLSSTNSLSATAGHLTRVVNYSAADTRSLGFVSGLLSKPELYYVNMHSVDRPGGLIRGQLQASSVSFRPALSPASEVPPITNVDAQAAAMITVNVNRDESGTIVSGTVAFDVNYRFPGSATIVGMHIHNGAEGVSGPVVISSGMAGAVTTSSGRGTLYRVATVRSTDATGLKALAGLMTDPSQYYVNIHTSTHPGGLMRGQLQNDALSFYSQMRGSEEVPPNASTGSADVLTTISVNRDGAGNITNGKVTFAASYTFSGPVNLVGFHIHNANQAVSGPVVISSGLGSGANSVSSDSGSGSFTRDVTIDAGNSTGISALSGLFTAPESYYVNIHTPAYPGGEIRAQLQHETYHYQPAISSTNETAPIAVTASGNAALTVIVNRTANGTVDSGTVTFDVDYNLGGPATIVGMHVHSGEAGANGPVVIGSGIGSISSSSGTGNITSSVAVATTDTKGVSALAGLISNPGSYYLNLHTNAYPSGLMRGQLLPYVRFEPQLAGGGQWMSMLTITNPSATSSAAGLVEVFDRSGNPMGAGVIDSTIPFLLPPSGSATFSTYNGGSLSDGYARIHSSAPVKSGVGYAFDGLPSVPAVSSVVGTTVTLPVAYGNGGILDTGIAMLNLDPNPPTAVLTLRDSSGGLVPGGTTALSFPSGRRVVGLLKQLFPTGLDLGTLFSGTLTIQLVRGPFPGGTMSVTALQFDSGSVTPVPLLVVQ